MTKQQIRIPATENRVGIIERLTKMLHALPTAKAWVVEVSEYHPTRSGNQNRYLFGVVYPTILAAGKLEGWDKDDLHEYYLGEHFGWERLDGMGRPRVKPIRRSSKLTKMEFVAFTDFIMRKAAEMGIYVPAPNELEQAA